MSKDPYNLGIKSPIYEIHGDNPDIRELCDCSKSEIYRKRILDAFSKGDISEQQRDFLILASHRLDVFYYNKIAEYYAHEDNSIMQDLMEQLALVIIDYDKAIENGYAKLGKDIQERILSGEW